MSSIDLEQRILKELEENPALELMELEDEPEEKVEDTEEDSDLEWADDGVFSDPDTGIGDGSISFDLYETKTVT